MPHSSRVPPILSGFSVMYHEYPPLGNDRSWFTVNFFLQTSRSEERFMVSRPYHNRILYQNYSWYKSLPFSKWVTSVIYALFHIACSIQRFSCTPTVSFLLRSATVSVISLSTFMPMFYFTRGTWSVYPLSVKYCLIT